MASYKTKLFKSQDGCCICRAKSSSSRFTSSGKYEENFEKCFDLEEDRNGEICNACVLIVKRWKKLPLTTTKNWSHVVDSRSGPGLKSLQRPIKKDEVFRHKHVYRRKHRPTRKVDAKKEADTGSESSHKESLYPDFVDSLYWKRITVCCGVVFVGQLGEVMFDQRFYRKCSPSSHPMKRVSEAPVIISDKDESECDYGEEMDDVEFYEKGDEKDKESVGFYEEEFLDKDDEKFETFASVEMLG